ncbi:hypothetical protein KOSB73_40158 [Klebsiella grimontii]|uniref:Uncharacterized protein n=1 Tax=Klebsiella grimontii TaxID=2058152 RepID=A0A285B9M3_9ENTR|nr:hypothetical protein KOSB73_40158 [Klebsiella grimontii]
MIFITIFSPVTFLYYQEKIPESVFYKFRLKYELITSRTTLQGRMQECVVEKCGNCVNSL